MQMMKFLRQYNKRILAVVTALILVSWLIGDPLRQFLSPDPSREAIGTAFGATIRQRDLVPTQNNTEILNALGVSWRSIARFSGEGARSFGIEHWHMLAQEARQAGIAVSESEIDEFFKFSPMAQMMVDGIRKRFSVSVPRIREAVREYLMIERLGASASGLNLPSERQIQHYVRETHDKIAVKIVTFKAADFADPAEKLDESELAAQYEQHRSKTPAEDDRGYGYKWGRRVRVEYLAAKVDAVLPSIKVSEDEVRRYYRKNKETDEFKKFELTTPTTQSTQPTTAPVAPTLTQRTLTLSEAKESIEKKLRERAAVTRIRSAMEAIAPEIAKPWTDQPVGKDGYKVAPEVVKQPDYLSSEAERYRTRFGIPLEFQRTELLTESAAAELSDIGTAFTSGEGADRLSFSEYAFRVPGFFSVSSATDAALRLALFQTPYSPLVSIDAGSQSRARGYFVFRVIESREPELPSNLDEVRTLVERDCREIRAFARAGNRAKEFFASARNVGIDAAFDLSPDLKDEKNLQKFRPGVTIPFPRRQSLAEFEPEKFMTRTIGGGATVEAPFVREIDARSPEFIEKCFELVKSDFVSPSIEPPRTTRPIAPPATTGPALRVNLIELPKLKMWAVVELKDELPVRQDEFASRYYPQARSMLAQQRTMAGRARWFNPAEIEKRSGFVRARLDTGEEVPVMPMQPEAVAPSEF